MAGEAFNGLASVPGVARAVVEFDVPAKYQSTSDGKKITTIGILELLPGEELMAAKRAGDDSAAQAFELAKQALAEVNGTPCTVGDGSADIWFANMCPQLRALVVTAYTDVNTPTKADAADFLKGRRIKSR